MKSFKSHTFITVIILHMYSEVILHRDLEDSPKKWPRELNKKKKKLWQLYTSSIP